MLCPNCKAEQRDEAKFCDNCGTRLAEARESRRPSPRLTAAQIVAEKPKKNSLPWMLAVVAIALLVVGGSFGAAKALLGGSSSGEGSTLSPTVGQTAVAQPSPGPAPSEMPTSTPEGGAGSSVLQSAEQVASAALTAAVRLFDGVSAADCKTNNPLNKPCITPQSEPSTALRGIAVFTIGEQGMPTSFTAVLGRGPAGEWKVWFRTQLSPYQLLRLPGNMRVCSEGAGLNVRSAPGTNAAIVGTLNEMDVAKGEEFVLTEPANDPAKPGYGWYQLSSPLKGWAYSKYLAAETALGNCNLRDQQERP